VLIFDTDAVIRWILVEESLHLTIDAFTFRLH